MTIGASKGEGGASRASAPPPIEIEKEGNITKY
jgi:hypothetical protein